MRFCGFNKVSSIAKRTITTSSLDIIDKFPLYLEKGWTIDLVPPIIYDQYLDCISTISLDSYFVDKYISKEIDNYQGSGQILIKK